MSDEGTTVELAEDDFDIAFEAAATSEAPPEEAPPEEAPPEEAPPEEAPPEEDPPEEAPPEEAPDPITIAAEAAAAVVEKQREITQAAEAEAQEATAAATAEAEAAAQESLTDDEQSLIEQVQIDFPEVAEAFAAQQRVLLAKVENLLTTKFSEVATQFDDRVTFTEAIAGQTAKTAHDRAIRDVHEDAFDIVPEIEKWVEAQPDFLQESYNNVLDNGNSAAVIKLVSMYKDSIEQPSETPSDANIEDEKKEEKLKAQEGVRSRRTGGRAAVDPDDFDGAFDKFAATA